MADAANVRLAAFAHRWKIVTVVHSSEHKLVDEDQEGIESLREEIRLARALIALQASKIHALEASADPTGPQLPESTSQDGQRPPPLPEPPAKSGKSGRRVVTIQLGQDVLAVRFHGANAEPEGTGAGSEPTASGREEFFGSELRILNTKLQ